MGTEASSTGRGKAAGGGVPDPRPARPRALAYGVRVGEFVLQRKLGAGGMGEVWLAHQPAMDRLVAVKVLHERLTDDPSGIADFLAEVRVSAKLHHPNIVTAITAGVADGEHYLVTAFVEGEDLGCRIADTGGLPEAEALRIVRQVAAALDYAWTRHRMMHRDVKPTNVMLTPDGHVRLLDMGVARILAHGETLRVDPYLAGTPNYMSPEMATGEGPVDCRADIYGLGATLYHMLTGRMPYAGLAPQDVVDRLAVEPPEPVRALRPDLSAACLRLLDGMMARDVGCRYADWTEVLADLQRVRRRAPPLGPGVARRAVRVVRSAAGPASGRRLPRRRSGRIGTLVSVAGLLVLAGAGIFAARRWLPEDAFAPPPPPPAAPDEDPRSPEAARREYWRGLWQAAEAYAEAWPDDIAGVVARFEAVIEQAPGTPFAAEAQARLEALSEARQRAVEKVWLGLDREASARAESGRVDDAVRLLNDYDGPFAADTAVARRARAESLRRDALRAAAAADPAAAERRVGVAVRRADAALASGLAAHAREALAEVRALAPDPALRQWADVWAREVEALEAMDEALEARLRAHIGEDLDVNIEGATVRVRVTDVHEGRVAGARVDGGRPALLTFHPGRLSLDDRLALLRAQWPAERRALARALDAARRGALDAAATHFDEAGLDADGVREALRRRADDPDEARAAAVAASALRTLGLPDDALDRTDPERMLRPDRLTEAHLADALRPLAQLRGMLGGTVFAEARAAAIASLQAEIAARASAASPPE